MAAGWLQDHGLGGRADVATMVGAFAFTVFAIASMAQLVVGSLLDRVGARPVFMGAAAVQLVFFGLMAGSREGWALALALGFMLGAFGQIPINDFMIGKMASGAARARVYGIRYVVSFTALAAALPLICLRVRALGLRHAVLCAVRGSQPRFSRWCPACRAGCRPRARRRRRRARSNRSNDRAGRSTRPACR